MNCTTSATAQGVMMQKKENPRCPDCGRITLYFKKRTGEYACKQCPFVGKIKIEKTAQKKK